MNGECRYRGLKSRQGKSDQRCALGLLIPDEKYYPELEGKCCNDPWIRNAVLLPDGMSYGELDAIQLVHDGLADAYWRPEVFVNKINDLPCFQNVFKIGA